MTRGLSIQEGFAKMAALYTRAFPYFRDYARYSIDAAASPLTSESVVHDNACGAGAVSAEIIHRFKQSGAALPKITATDMSPPMVAQAVKENPELTDARVMDAKNLDLPEGTYTHSFTNYLLSPSFKHEDNVAFVRNVRRTLAPGGTAVFGIWYTLDWMLVMKEAASSIRPDGATFVQDHDFPKAKVQEILAEGGFEADGLEITTHESESPPLQAGPFREMLDVISAIFQTMITATWTEEQKSLWPEKMKEKLDQGEAEGRRFKMAAWIVTAKV